MAVLLLGNGINNLDNENSWNELLDDIISSIGKNNVIDRNNRSLLLLYEEICSRVMNYTSYNEDDIKDKIIQSLKKIEPNKRYETIRNLGFTDILTTNYEYTLTPEANGIFTRETKHNLRRFQKYGNITVWHIHGEINNPNSIIIGYRHYMSSIDNIKKAIKRHRENEKMKKGPTWIDIFLNNDIYILGLTLSLEEHDLWYLLAYRNKNIQENKIEKNKIEKNKIVFLKRKESKSSDILKDSIEKYCTTQSNECISNIEQQAIKQSKNKEKEKMLKIFGVEIKEIDNTANYEEYYDKAIEYLREQISQD